jgi:GR25 family glycosyltransferase involved in LPS biosynthesis
MKIDRIFYINLDEHVDRRNEMEYEFEKMDIISHEQPNPDKKLTYERFSAIQHDSVDIGRGKSHIGVLKIAKERGYSNIIIFEDDFIFTVSKEEFYKQLSYLDGVYLDACLLSGNLMNYNNSAVTYDLYRVVNARTTSGYLVNCRYNDTLIKCFQTVVEKSERINNHLLYTIDIAWVRLQATDPWYALKTMIGKKRLVCRDTFCNA